MKSVSIKILKPLWMTLNLQYMKSVPEGVILSASEKVIFIFRFQ